MVGRHPIQRAALNLLDPHKADQEAMAIQNAFGLKRDRIVSRLRSMGMRLEAVPEGAFYTFPSLADLPPSLQDGMAFFRAALEEKVIVVPGKFFDVNPGSGATFLPVCATMSARLASNVQLGFDETAFKP